jgi:hypothetical protein
MTMHAELSRGTLVLHVSQFTLREAERMHELFEALAPFSRVVLDFTDARQISGAALVAAAVALRTLRGTEIVVNGLADPAVSHLAN